MTDDVKTEAQLPLTDDGQRLPASSADEREQVPRQAHDSFAKAALQDLQVSRAVLQSRLAPA